MYRNVKTSNPVDTKVIRTTSISLIPYYSDLYMLINVIGSRSRKWKALQLATLGNTFEVLAQHRIGGMQLAVYAKKKLANKVTGFPL